MDLTGNKEQANNGIARKKCFDNSDTTPPVKKKLQQEMISTELG